MKNSLKRKGFFLYLFIFLGLLTLPTIAVFTQEEDIRERFDWLYGQRYYPYTTLPSNVFIDAINERDELISNNGYQLQAAAPWNFMGPQPYNSAFGIVSGRIKAVKFDSRDASGNTFYAVGNNGGLWKTTDGGTTWIDKNGQEPNKLPVLNCQAFDLDAQNGILYIGTGECGYFGGGYMGVGLYKSTDDGNSWTRAWNSPNLPQSTLFYKIVIAPNNPNIIYAAEWTGLYRTNDGGNNWSKVLPTNGADRNCTDIAISPSGAKIYAIGYSPQFWTEWFYGIGFWVSNNYGVNWVQVDPSSGFPHQSASNYQYGRSLLSTSASSENTVYVLTYDAGTDANWVYRSGNGGSNFDLPYRNQNGDPIPIYNPGGNNDFNMVLKCSPYDASTCFVGFQNLLITTNGGQNWPDRTTSHVDHHALDFCPNPQIPNRVIAGSDGGIYSSTNLGVNWASLNNNLGLAQVWMVGSNVYNADNILAGIEDEGIGYKSSYIPGETEWSTTSIEDRDGTLNLSSPFKRDYFIGSVGVCYNPMYYSTNGGINYYSSANYLLDNCNCWTGQGCTTSGGWIPLTVNHPSEPGTIFTVRWGNSNDYNTPIHVLKSTNYGISYNGNDPYHFQFANNMQQKISPNYLAISQSDPNLMLMSWVIGSHPYWLSQGYPSRLIKSTDGGVSWQTNPPLLVGGPPSDVPDRFFSHVEIDPVNKDIIYLTLSGYNTGHVFRSTNGGINWTNISTQETGLPNSPTNDLVIHYTSSNTKEIIVAQDVGVWVTDAENLQWRALAENLPNSPVYDLDHNRLSGKLNASVFGRGVWQVDLPGSIYVQDKLYITDNVTLDKPIVVASGGKLIIGHSDVNPSMTINFSNGANIVVEEGGTLLANSNVAVNLTSSGSWSGIRVNGNTSNCVLYNCTFSNTSTPIVVTGSQMDGIPNPPEYGVIFHDCHFTNAPIEVSNRSDVVIRYCDWTMNSTETDAIVAAGADGIYILDNDIIFSSQVSGSHAIQLSQCNDATITLNTITAADYPITVSNATTYIRYSTITSNPSYPSTSYTGISLNGVSNGHLIYNNVNGYQVGYYLGSSSPTALMNTADGSNVNGEMSALYCYNNSSPRLYPTDDGGQLIWDAGLNYLRNNASGSRGLFVDESAPELDYGYNHIIGSNNIEGSYSGSSPWYVRCNSWGRTTPIFSVNNVYMEYEPVDCTPPDSRPNQNILRGGSEKKGDIPEDEVTPPQPIIVNYGNGLFDTFHVAVSNNIVTADVALFGSGEAEVYAGSFSNAIGIFENVIESYQDSSTAILALNRIFYSNNRMNADSSAYSLLRNYYTSLASANSRDSSFAKTAMELSRKCLIRQKNYIAAISAYEDVISTSTDPVEVAASEISIIEIYTLMNTTEGDVLSFTGRYASLKPNGLKDAMKKIREKMGHKEGSVANVNVPKEFNLSQNYPNPFNPLTKINYSIPQNITVTLKVYDILGRLVKTLVNEYQNAGSYTVTFDGSGLASGIYFYKIEAGDFVQSKKMVLVK
jgi:photosystem II stability/assembly factor-like uncharacterized protein